ncbi:hypothetical protein M9H77_24149 [Catharanthus roseus]|uniref:Uncharacterized protein n=1 Tax=Catharanthus roseus TaxID=4058 RepID=A0ACC0AVP9_CATRO|nr:hypothetical protein M9H77_24149 [Catharanthus roseus]
MDQSIIMWNAPGAGSTQFIYHLKLLLTIYYPQISIIVEAKVANEKANRVLKFTYFDAFVAAENMGFASVYASPKKQLRDDLWRYLIKIGKCVKEVVNNGQWIDVGFSEPRFTWANNYEDSSLIHERLDRFWCKSLWLEIVTDTTVKHVINTQSDHHPILLTCSKQGSDNPFPHATNRSFKVLEAWYLRPSFHQLVASIWETEGSDIRRRGTRNFPPHPKDYSLTKTAWQDLLRGHNAPTLWQSASVKRLARLEHIRSSNTGRYYSDKCCLTF